MIKNRIILSKPYKDVCPVQCGTENCSPSHKYGPAIRTHYLLHFVVSGKGSFSTQRGTFKLGKNEMFIIRPYEITYYEADGEDPWTYIWIGFTCNTEMPTALTSSDTLYAPFLEKIFSDAVNTEAFRNGHSGYEAFLCGKIFEIFSLLYLGDTVSSEASERYVKPAVSIMEAEFGTGIRVSDVADRLHVNRSYFSVLFKEIMKKAPGEYLSELRMREAARLLRVYKCSVTVTAESVGYPDVFVFSRAFKHYYGCSPTEYASKY